MVFLANLTLLTWAQVIFPIHMTTGQSVYNLDYLNLNCSAKTVLLGYFLPTNGLLEYQFLSKVYVLL